MKMFKIFKLVILLIFVGNVLYAQNIVNSLGVIHVSGNPNSIPALDAIDQKIEGAIAKDTTSGAAWVYDAGASPVWQPIYIGVGSDEHVTSATVSGTAGTTTRTLTLGRAEGADITEPFNVDDGDSDDTNEIQTLSWDGTTIGLSSGGGAHDLSALKTDDFITDLTWTGTGNTRDFTINRDLGVDIVKTGFSVADDDSSASNEAQTVSSSGTVSTGSIALDQVGGAGGGTVTLTGDAIIIDGSVSNTINLINAQKVQGSYISNAAAKADGVLVGEFWECAFGSTECTKGQILKAY